MKFSPTNLIINNFFGWWSSSSRLGWISRSRRLCVCCSTPLNAICQTGGAYCLPTIILSALQPTVPANITWTEPVRRLTLCPLSLLYFSCCSLVGDSSSSFAIAVLLPGALQRYRLLSCREQMPHCRGVYCNMNGSQFHLISDTYNPPFSK